MDKIFFGLKRAYYGTLRVTRRPLASMELTAARFDLLYILEKAGGQMPQRAIQRALGVARSTVSRMLRSLEDLGLVEREILLEDQRCMWVELTNSGRRSVLAAARLLIRTGRVKTAVEGALCPSGRENESACLLARGACDRTLRRFRYAYGDVATLEYPLVPGYVPPDFNRYLAVLLAPP